MKCGCACQKKIVMKTLQVINGMFTIDRHMETIITGNFLEWLIAFNALDSIIGNYSNKKQYLTSEKVHELTRY